MYIYLVWRHEGCIEVSVIFNVKAYLHCDDLNHFMHLRLLIKTDFCNSWSYFCFHLHNVKQNMPLMPFPLAGSFTGVTSSVTDKAKKYLTEQYY